MERPSLLIKHKEQESNTRIIVCEFASTAVITCSHDYYKIFQAPDRLCKKNEPLFQLNMWQEGRSPFSIGHFFSSYCHSEQAFCISLRYQLPLFILHLLT